MRAEVCATKLEFSQKTTEKPIAKYLASSFCGSSMSAEGTCNKIVVNAIGSSFISETSSGHRNSNLCMKDDATSLCEQARVF